jgi:hypothetical protein
MAGFRVEKQTAGSVTLDDLGITLTGGIGTIVDLTDLAPEDVARSADLLAAIPALVLVVDPRDDTNATILTSGESTNAVNRANDTHFGISGGRLGAIDDPTITPGANFIIQYNSGGDEFEYIDPDVFVSNQSSSISVIVGGMGQDGSDTTFVFDESSTPIIEGQDETNYDGGANNGAFVGGDGVGGTAYVASDTITLGDGSVILVDAVDGNGDVTDFTVTTNGGNVTTGVLLAQSGTSGTGTGFTITPEQNNVSQGVMQWDVNDSYLRNDGDTLDSGTLSIASGAAVSFSAGSSITIDTAVTTATIITPAGGFTNDDDLINKAYVDAVAAGLDWKDSVRIATTAADGDILAASFGSGTYTAAGGPSASGQFTLIDLSSGTGDTIDGLNFTGVSTTGLIIGDRVLIKDQTDAKQNGIYEISAGSVSTSVILTRSDDQDGTPASEVSAGNATYVEDTTAIFAGSVNSTTGWVVIGDGELTLNTDDINWVQFSGVNTIIAGIALSNDGLTYDVDVDDATTATAVLADSILFHDSDGTPAASGSITRKSTFSSLFSELDVPNAITSNGFIVRTADDTYASRSITVSGAGPLDGLAVSNGDGVSADPVIGLDIQNMTLRAAIDSANDRIAVWDSSLNTNVYYTVSDVAGAASASDSFKTWTRAGNGTGDASIIATSSTDTVTVTGGIGITIGLTAASDIITYSFTRLGMADTAVVLADTVPFFDASNANEPEYRSWSDIISDLSITTGISAATDEDLTGIDVTGTVIGLDILGLSAAGDDMAATDEFPLHDKSEGTAGANGKITGTNIAEGTAAILGIATLTFDTFPAVTSPADDQTLLAYTDAGRSKTLSVESHTFQWSDNKVKDNDWLSIGKAGDADSGWVMPLDATIVGITAHTEDTGGGNTFDIDLYIGVADSGSVATLTGGANAEDTDPTLNIDVDAGVKIRLRADQSAGAGDMQDTTVALLIKWRS